MFDALKSLDLEALPEGVREAVLAAQRDAIKLANRTAALVASNASIAEQNATLATQNGELAAVNARLEHMVKELNHLHLRAKTAVDRPQL